jgi:AraC-like DNA-binding protein
MTAALRKADAFRKDGNDHGLRRPHLTPPSGLQRALALIWECSDTDLTLDQLVAHTRLSKTYFVRAFRRAYGASPCVYLMHVRVERARLLLQSGVRPIDAAMQVGFYDQSHLNRWFVRVYGVTPKAYAEATAGRRIWRTTLERVARPEPICLASGE